MDINELFNLGNQFHTEGQVQKGVDMWTECVRRDKMFGPAYINLFNFFKSTGNLQQAKECLIKFSNCPLTMQLLDMVPRIKQEMQDLEKQMNPQPVPAAVTKQQTEI